MINLHLMSILYFGMFTVAILLNGAHGVFLFPKVGEAFAWTMCVDIVFGLIVGVGFCLVTWALSKTITLFKEVSSDMAKTLGDLSTRDIFFISSFSALGEEFFFRGALQHYIGLLPSAAIFGLMHIGPDKRYWLWTAFAVLTGCMLGVVYEWRENLILPVVIHFTINFVNLLSMSRRPQEPAMS